MTKKEKETQLENKNSEIPEIDLQSKIDELEAELIKTNEMLKDQMTKANQYLTTASYYKNESESTKKDFDRYKERNKNIEAEAVVKANETMAKKLLPIIDNFDQAIAHVDSEIMKGFSMIYASLVNCLTDIGIVEIETTGVLNPEEHNCISTEPTEEEDKDGTISTCYQKGYKFADSNKVVRPATVSVYKIM